MPQFFLSQVQDCEHFTSVSPDLNGIDPRADPTFRTNVERGVLGGYSLVATARISGVRVRMCGATSQVTIS